MIKKRDNLLDITKGLGIMLVVLGHTLQGYYNDFDHNIIFRVIYSFHMPLFFFTSGAILCLKTNSTQRPIQTESPKVTPLKQLIDQCKKSFLHLVIPFSIWTIILFFTGRRYDEMHFTEWLLMVGKSVDYSLWFLIVMFNCLIFYYLSQYLFSSSGIENHPKFRHLTPECKQVTFLVSSLLLSTIFIKLLPNWLGIPLFKQYYIYLITGGLWQVYFRHKLPPQFEIITTLIFILLVPFWYRIEASSIVIFLSEYIKHSYADFLYKFTVAISGTLTILTLASLIQHTQSAITTKTVSFLGRMSLGIYAFHLHFFSIKPYFLAPLLLSIVACLIVSRISIVRLLLLGLTSFQQKQI